MKISIDNLFWKIDCLESINKKQSTDINALRIENLFLKEQLHKLKKAALINQQDEEKGERAGDYQFSSNSNILR